MSDASPTDGGVEGDAQAVLSDGVVTVDEYQTQFTAFETCAEAAGGAIDYNGADPTTGRIEYGVAIELGEKIDAAVEGCYQDHFASVERFFELNDPIVLATNEADQIKLLYDIHIPCLEKNEVDFVVPESTGSEEYTELMETYDRLRNDGLCDPLPGQ